MNRLVFAAYCLVGAGACIWDLMTARHRWPWQAVAITARKHGAMWRAFTRWEGE